MLWVMFSAQAKLVQPCLLRNVVTFLSTRSSFLQMNLTSIDDECGHRVFHQSVSETQPTKYASCRSQRQLRRWTECVTRDKRISFSSRSGGFGVRSAMWERFLVGDVALLPRNEVFFLSRFSTGPKFVWFSWTTSSTLLASSTKKY